MKTHSTQLYVHESGTPGSAAIVFLHGDAATGGMWDQHIERLVGYHCLAPDLPGHGRSNYLPWTSLDDTAQQVAALIQDRIPARRAHLSACRWAARSPIPCWPTARSCWIEW